MTSGIDDRGGRRAPAPGRGRVALAFVASVLATLVVSVPLAYQATAADDRPRDRPTTTTTRPASVLPAVIERSGPEPTWTAVDGSGAPRLLQGAVLSGRVRVSVEFHGTTRVSVWIDDLDTRRRPDDVDDVAPFTLQSRRTASEAGGTLDTTRLRNGLNVVLVRVDLEDGTSLEQAVAFVVANPD